MRFKTAAILSVVLVGGILFVFPAVIEGVFLPSLRKGVPNPIPDYEANLLAVAFFFHRYSWILAPLSLALFFLIAAVSSKPAPRR